MNLNLVRIASIFVIVLIVGSGNILSLNNNIEDDESNTENLVINQSNTINSQFNNDATDVTFISYEQDIVNKNSFYRSNLIIQPGPSSGKDAYINEASPNTNYGSYDYLWVGSTQSAQDKFSFLEFSFSSIPSDAIIESATLYLYSFYSEGVSQLIQLFQLSTPWNENTVNWNDAPYYFNDEYTAAIVDGTGWKSWDATNHVMEWWNGETINNGFYLRHTTLNDNDNVNFYSSDFSTDVSLRPKVVIEYTIPPIPEVKMNYFEYPEEISLGETAFIKVVGKNNGGDSAEGELQLSFPDLPDNDADSDHLWVVDGTDFDSVDIYWPGDLIYTNYGSGYQIPADYPLVDGLNNPWDGGITDYFTVEIKPTQIGEFRIFIKMTIEDNSGVWYGSPEEDGTETSLTDQQNEYVYVRTINVIQPNQHPNPPDNPNPDNGLGDVSLSTDLSWSCSDPDLGDTLVYDVYLGTNPNPGTNELVSEDQSSNTYDPDLIYDTHYYWKIVAKDIHGATTEGPVWEFITVQETNNLPPTVEITNPSDGEIIRGDVTISGNAQDSNGDHTLEVVQIKIDSDKPDIASGTSSWSYQIDTTELTEGEHMLYARSYDGEEFSDEVSISVTVDNDYFNPPEWVYTLMDITGVEKGLIDGEYWLVSIPLGSGAEYPNSPDGFADIMGDVGMVDIPEPFGGIYSFLGEYNIHIVVKDYLDDSPVLIALSCESEDISVVHVEAYGTEVDADMNFGGAFNLGYFDLWINLHTHITSPSVGHQFFLPTVPPIPITVHGNLFFDSGLTFYFKTPENWDLTGQQICEIFDSIEGNMEIGGSVYFGVGIQDLIEGGVRTDVSGIWEFATPEPLIDDFSINIRLYLYAICLGWEGNFLFYEEGWSLNGGRMRKTLSSDDFDWNPIPRVYGDQEWLGNKSNVLLEEVYPFAFPDSDSLGEKRMMVWVYDNKSKDILDGLEVMYSIWDGENWSEPDFVTNDCCFEFNPDVAFLANGDALCVFDYVPEGISHDNFFNASTIAYSIWNHTFDEWSPVHVVEDTVEKMDNSPVITSFDNQAVVVWQCDNDGDRFTINDTVLYASFWDEDWDNTRIISKQDQHIISAYSLVYNGTEASCAYIVDDDGNFSGNDTDLYVATFSPMRNLHSVEPRLSRDNVVDASPSIGHCNNGRAVAWLKATEDNLTNLYYKELDGDEETIIAHGNFTNPYLLSNSTGSPIIGWQNNSGKKDFYIATKEGGSWNISKLFSPPVLFSNPCWSFYDCRLSILGVEKNNVSSFKNCNLTHFIENEPPNNSSIIGTTVGEIGIEYSYLFSSDDPEGDIIYYYIDWRDGTDSDWLGPFESGESIIMKHSWDESGIYDIKVKVKDKYDSESDWSYSATEIIADYSSNVSLKIFGEKNAVYPTHSYYNQDFIYTNETYPFDPGVIEKDSITFNAALYKLSLTGQDGVDYDEQIFLRAFYELGFHHGRDDKVSGPEGGSCEEFDAVVTETTYMLIKDDRSPYAAITPIVMELPYKADLSTSKPGMENMDEVSVRNAQYNDESLVGGSVDVSITLEVPLDQEVKFLDHKIKFIGRLLDVVNGTEFWTYKAEIGYLGNYNENHHSTIMHPGPYADVGLPEHFTCFFNRANSKIYAGPFEQPIDDPAYRWFVKVINWDEDYQEVRVKIGRRLFAGETFYVDGVRYDMPAICVNDNDQFKYIAIQSPLPKAPGGEVFDNSHVDSQWLERLNPCPEYVWMLPPFDRSHIMIDDIGLPKCGTGVIDDFLAGAQLTESVGPLDFYYINESIEERFNSSLVERLDSSAEEWDLFGVNTKPNQFIAFVLPNQEHGGMLYNELSPSYYADGSEYLFTSSFIAPNSDEYTSGYGPCLRHDIVDRVYETYALHDERMEYVNKSRLVFEYDAENTNDIYIDTNNQGLRVYGKSGTAYPTHSYSNTADFIYLNEIDPFDPGVIIGDSLTINPAFIAGFYNGNAIYFNGDADEKVFLRLFHEPGYTHDVDEVMEGFSPGLDPVQNFDAIVVETTYLALDHMQNPTFGSQEYSQMMLPTRSVNPNSPGMEYGDVVELHEIGMLTSNPYDADPRNYINITCDLIYLGLDESISFMDHSLTFLSYDSIHDEGLFEVAYEGNMQQAMNTPDTVFLEFGETYFFNRHNELQTFTDPAHRWWIKMVGYDGSDTVYLEIGRVLVEGETFYVDGVRYDIPKIHNKYFALDDEYRFQYITIQSPLPLSTVTMWHSGDTINELNQNVNDWSHVSAQWLANQVIDTSICVLPPLNEPHYMIDDIGLSKCGTDVVDEFLAGALLTTMVGPLDFCYIEQDVEYTFNSSIYERLPPISGAEIWDLYGINTMPNQYVTFSLPDQEQLGDDYADWMIPPAYSADGYEYLLTSSFIAPNTNVSCSGPCFRHDIVDRVFEAVSNPYNGDERQDYANKPRLTFGYNAENDLGIFTDFSISANNPPQADFNWVKTAEFTFEFTDNSTDSDGSVVSWFWYFDDGTSDVGETIIHEFSSAREYTIMLAVVDNDGLTTTCSKTIQIDETPPITTVAMSPPKYGDNDEFVTSNTEFNLTANDDFSGVNTIFYRFWHNGRWNPQPGSASGSNHDYSVYTGNFSLSKTGKHFLEFYSVDNAANVEMIHNQTHFVDDSSPTTTVAIDEPHYPEILDGCNVSSITQFMLTASDQPVLSVGTNYTWYTIDDDFYQGSSFNLSGYDEGMHTITYGAIDYLGNNETGKNITLWIDDSPPSTNIDISEQVHPDTGGNGCNITSSTTINLLSNDYPSAHNAGIDQCWYTINNDFYQGSSFNLSGYDEGMHTITYGAIDYLGNNETGKNITLWIDDSPPRTILEPDFPYIIEEKTMWVTPRTLLHLHSYDQPEHACGVKDILYRVNNSEWVSYNEGFYLEDEQCSYQLSFYCIDHLSNTEKIQRFTVHVDDTPPVSNITIGQPHFDDWENIINGDVLLYDDPIRMLDPDDLPLFVTSKTYFQLDALDLGECPARVGEIFYRTWNLFDGWSEWKTYLEKTDDYNNKPQKGFVLNHEGLHYIEYYAEDRLGNTEKTVHNLTCMVDNSPPITTGSGYNPVILDATDYGGGNVAYMIPYETLPEYLPVWLHHIHYRYKIGDDENWTQWQMGELNRNVAIQLGPGDQFGEPIYVEYYAKDILGNTEKMHHEVFKHNDLFPPLP